MPTAGEDPAQWEFPPDVGPGLRGGQPARIPGARRGRGVLDRPGRGLRARSPRRGTADAGRVRDRPGQDAADGEGGVLGLQRLPTGRARTVVASYWRIGDRATREFVVEFYRNLSIRKLSKVEAFRRQLRWGCSSDTRRPRRSEGEARWNDRASPSTRARPAPSPRGMSCRPSSGPDSRSRATGGSMPPPDRARTGYRGR